ncbi:MAG: DNA repair protein RecN [Candidatus Scalindua arabica]|uniref:DNA repair protein RecN n=1 Tax=Candidatus Scalindua arabica TaxID=1127984 RepID=A0A942A3M9_9BACT|nr:DNA repair protein RecN [Candidatus Scalindua arabica]
MLSELYISNFALIDDITVKFNKGLNIFTGTTGVGKSLIIGALNFLLGSRITNDIVRTGKKDVSVSGAFTIKNEHIRERLKEYIDNFDEEEIIIQRNLDQNGRNRCRLNNQPITVPLLKEIGELLVNIHGQHEHESLTKPLNQLIILDGFGKLDTNRGKFSEVYTKAIEKERLIQSLNEHQEARKRQIELYQFEVNEIEGACLKPDELDILEKERFILANSEKIQNTLSYCTDSLYESDNSIISRLKEISNELSKIKDIDISFENPLEICNQSLFQLEDVAITLSKCVEGHDFDPERLEQIEGRIETIHRLKGKYGETIEDILSYCKESKSKLEQLLKENEDLGSTENELEKLRKSVIDSGKRLTKLREKASTKLSNLVKKELSDLGIANGRFDIDISSLDMTSTEQFNLEDGSRSGFDHIEFMFSSNPGEELKPLRKIASGGEISRIMLALKRHLASADQTPVLIFDEIDANIGGRMGRIIGEKLRLVSQSHQVICITHLPQIASYAEQHFKVNKFAENNKTFVTIDILSAKERLEEIAEMIRGTEKTEVTRKQAKEMIDDARKFVTT